MAFIITMDNYSYSRFLELWFIKMAIGKVNEIHRAKKNDINKKLMPYNFEIDYYNTENYENIDLTSLHNLWKTTFIWWFII